ncbi:MAG: type II CAAX endopeptidase family protein [Chitinophagaceae bacterium]
MIFGILTMGLLLIINIVGAFVIVLFAGITPQDLQGKDLSKPAVLSSVRALLAVSTIGSFLVPSLVFAYLSDRSPLQYIGFKKPVPLFFLLIAVVVIIGAFPMVAWLGEINQNMHLPKSMQKTENLLREVEAKGNQFQHGLLIMKSRTDLIIMLVVLAVLPAVAEEIFFRGVLQRLFIQLTRRPWTGIITTAILFSAIHFQFLGFIPRLVLGIVLGALYWFSGSIWPGILAHFINNGLQIILVYHTPQLMNKEPDFTVGLIACSTILVVALTWWMQKLSQTSYAEVYDTDDDFHIGPRDQYIA